MSAGCNARASVFQPLFPCILDEGDDVSYLFYAAEKQSLSKRDVQSVLGYELSDISDMRMSSKLTVKLLSA